MRVLHINSADSGGAFIAMDRIHQELLRQGVDSKILVLNKSSNRDDITAYKTGQMSFVHRLYHSVKFRYYKHTQAKILNSITDKYSPFTFPSTAFDILSQKEVQQADIIHLHWISNFVDIPTFFKKISKPIIWTLHDMNPFTGGCHHSKGCDKFQTRCHQCHFLPPAFQEKNDVASQNFDLKQKAFQEVPIRIIGNSNWTTTMAKQSTLFQDKDITTIQLGIDTQKYKPVDKKAIKQKLGISDDYFVIGFGATGLDIELKGFKYLFQALQIVTQKYKILCLTFGAGKVKEEYLKGLEMRSLGYIDSIEEQVDFYNALDVFIIPSLAESFGQTCLEAMACGTPVIGTDVGGIPDMIQHNKTGLLIRPADTQDLVDKIEQVIIQPQNLQPLVQNALAHIKANFDIIIQTNRYRQLYEVMLSQK